MTSRSGLRQSHVLGLTILFVVGVMAAVCGVLLVQDTKAEARSIWVGDSHRHEGWQTVAYREAAIDIPYDWKPADVSTCGFEADGWAPAPASEDGTVCERREGIFFYAEETYDAITAPGQIASTVGDQAVGYEVAGTVAVTASGDQETVTQILESVRKR